MHVDFCCIFDRAKSLRVPETVPFRLTQNVVAAMGVLGADGSFRRVCEVVMGTLRAKKAKLLSVLRPFLYDPLLEWKHDASKGSSEMTAKLVLREIESRLDGVSEDRTTVTSPECTVRRLIVEATSVRNLATMYRGWQPFM